MGLTVDIAFRPRFSDICYLVAARDGFEPAAARNNILFIVADVRHDIGKIKYRSAEDETELGQARLSNLEALVPWWYGF